MVLKDGLFHSMTYKDWKQSTQPKVLGAQNLHAVLADEPLDFFPMTSSVSGILGTPGQSNYAAANYNHVVVGLDPAKLQKAVNDSASTDSFWLHDARFSHAVHSINVSSDEAGAGAQLSILTSIRAVESPAEAVALICQHFIDNLSRMLMLDPADVDAEVGSIASYGIDSMAGAELPNWIFKEFAMDMPLEQLPAPSLTISKFATQVCQVQNIVES
ncbi:hypothetical protein Asppvi_008424 [Aspergillus pseudoviridinutans]|uniref:Carrier domain-containing protein n=1 Tax=Aspergillus pseudoviridinutans TaxID=1517512 RepID=A0A9P3EXE2_9EURO|nr:uncharacterized protein Asppvi_008424 [Aspergillus pseudoviridinutans]GIJ89482.1 hypothetical protein Asppvi_008424 [Aspergillus pseudoviridinutans]